MDRYACKRPFPFNHSTESHRHWRLRNSHRLAYDIYINAGRLNRVEYSTGKYFHIIDIVDQIDGNASQAAAFFFWSFELVWTDLYSYLRLNRNYLTNTQHPHRILSIEKSNCISWTKLPPL